MMTKRTVPLIRVWMWVTWLFAFPIAAVSWALHSRMGADRKRFSERLGRHASPDNAPVLWFHAASLGEVMQIAPLSHDLAQTENIKILVTTTTATGADWVAQNMPHATHRFVSIDTPSAVRRFLDGWSISAAIFVEGDLWPRLLGELEKRGVPQILLNARHSSTRARLPEVFSALLTPFVLVTCRSEVVAEEISSLGLSPDRIHVLPDLRLTVQKLAAPQDALDDLVSALSARPVWLAASTHPADEAAVLAAQEEVLEAYPDALLILAPRHTNRGLPLDKLAQSKALTTARRSVGEEVSPATQVYIADTLGELGVFYSLSTIAFLGGSFGQEGGHNPYEPAQLETALVYGHNVKNFSDAYEALRLAGAAVQIETPGLLGGKIVDLMRGDQAKEMAEAGLGFMEGTRRSTLTYADLIRSVLRRTDEAP